MRHGAWLLLLVVMVVVVVVVKVLLFLSTRFALGLVVVGVVSYSGMSGITAGGGGRRRHRCCRFGRWGVWGPLGGLVDLPHCVTVNNKKKKRKESGNCRDFSFLSPVVTDIRTPPSNP